MSVNSILLRSYIGYIRPSTLFILYELANFFRLYFRKKITETFEICVALAKLRASVELSVSY